MTTVRQVFTAMVRRLEDEHLADAYFEARTLLSNTLAIPTTAIYTSSDRKLRNDEITRLRGVLQRRLTHEPAAYIAGHREFYGREFMVDRSTLIPRPETEILIDRAINFTTTHKVSEVADIGTGSGAIAVTLALELPHVRVYAVDISAAALRVAQANGRRYGVTYRISFLHGNLLEPLSHPIKMVVANLPYITDEEFRVLPPEIARYEPAIALRGGHDGLEIYRALLKRISEVIYPGGCLLAEIGCNQAELFLKEAKAAIPRFKARVYRDGNNIDRVVRLIVSQ